MCQNMVGIPTRVWIIGFDLQGPGKMTQIPQPADNPVWCLAPAMNNDPCGYPCEQSEGAGGVAKK